MQYMNLTVNGTVIFTAAACFNLKYIGAGLYQPYSGAFFFYDTQGTSDPIYTGLGSRFILLYRSADGTTLSSLPIQAVPSQSLTAILDNQNVAINLHEQVLATAQPTATLMPTGADQAYLNQALLAPSSAYVVPGYWTGYSL
jgi:hypothetical protein